MSDLLKYALRLIRLCTHTQRTILQDGDINFLCDYTLSFLNYNSWIIKERLVWKSICITVDRKVANALSVTTAPNGFQIKSHFP